MLDHLTQANLTVNLAKCEFAKATVTCLGKVVGQGEVHTVQAKVEALHNYPGPAPKEELMRFFGLVGYYWSFCPNFSTVVAPLTSLLKNRTEKICLLTGPIFCHDALECVKSLI